MAAVAHPQAGCSPVTQHPRAAVQPRCRVQHHAHGLRAGHAPGRQLRVVGSHRACAYHHRVAQSAQAMQVQQALWAGHEIRITRGRGHAAVQALPQLRQRPGEGWRVLNTPSLRQPGVQQRLVYIEQRAAGNRPTAAQLPAVNGISAQKLWLGGLSLGFVQPLARLQQQPPQLRPVCKRVGRLVGKLNRWHERDHRSHSPLAQIKDSHPQRRPLRGYPVQHDPSLARTHSLAADPGNALMNRPSPSLAHLLGADAAPIDRFAPGAAAIRVDRACTELRRGRPLLLSMGDESVPNTPTAWLLAVAVESLHEPLLRTLTASGRAPQLLLSMQRLHALGWPHASTPRAFDLLPDVSLLQLQQLAAVAPGPGDTALLGAPTAAGADQPALLALLSLCKRARLVPALLLLQLDPPLAVDAEDAKNAEHAKDAANAAPLLQFDPADIALMAPPGAAALRQISDARVPLDAAEDCRVVLFREVDGDAEHVAVVVGRPAADMPVPVRLHSTCLTGDLLGSLRCDCGPQLQQAVARLAQTGGVLLYLAQEGRGTGLANKLRAYRLQDAGLDTLQADRHLGFAGDERDYSAAAAMLQALGHTRIYLLTNNPQKIAALRQAGIEVVERWALPGPVNAHNAQYMNTKQKAGHLGSD